MKNPISLTKRITAMILSVMLVIGSTPGIVFAASTDVESGQASEVAQEVPALDISTEEPMNATTEEPAQYYTVTLDANDGYFKNEWDDAIGDYVQQAVVINKLIPVGGAVAVVPVLEQENAVVTFLGWSFERDGDIVGEEYAPVGDCTLYAVWKIEESATEEAFEEATELETTKNDEETDTKSETFEEIDTIEPEGTGALENNDENDEISKTEESSHQERGEVDGEKEEGANTYTEDKQKDIVPIEDIDLQKSIKTYEKVTANQNLLESNENTVASGTCGDNVFWELDKDGTLVIFGNGDMEDYTYENSASYSEYSEDITKIIIDGLVKHIGDYAFYSSNYYYNVQNIVLNEGVESIGYRSFYGVFGEFMLVEIPNSVSSIGENAFLALHGDASVYSSVIILCDSDAYVASAASEYSSWCLTDKTNKGDAGRNITYSFDLDTRTLVFSGTGSLYGGVFAFPGAYFTENIIFDNGIEDISYTSFPCANLKSISLPDGLLKVGGFSGCSHLEEITIPDSVHTITDYAFSDCTNLNRIVFSQSLISIGKFAFQNCSSLKEIQLYDTIRNIQENAFMDCANLEQVVIAKSTIETPTGSCYFEDYCFSECSNLNSFIFSERVSSIHFGLGVFVRCKNLKTINIPSDELVTDGSAFCETGLETIEINATKADIKEDDFGYCPNLYLIRFNRLITDGSIDTAAFNYTNINNVKLLIHEGSIIKMYAEIIGLDYSYLDHEWSAEGIIVNEPTCINTGLVRYQCDICSIYRTETIPALGHTWNESYTVDTPATCKKEGSESIHCSVCDEIKEGSPRSISKLDHAYGDWETVTEPTCTKEGNRKKVCAACGDTVTETIAALGHTWNESYTVDTPATCEEEGTESIHCNVCGAIQEGSARAIAKLAHTYGGWETVTAATCTEAGSRKKICSVCGDVVTGEIPATGHRWEKDYTVDREPTCSEEGSESIHCSVCDEIDTETVRAIPKKEHAYGDWTVTKEATCTEDGSKEKVCANCNDKVTETIPATGHTWNEEYTVDKEATYAEEGSESIHCSICDEIKEGTSKPIVRLLKPVSMLTVSGIVDKVYTGNALTQEILIKDGTTDLIQDTDYTVSYENNTNAGTASVTITGKGNYTGSKTITFKILPVGWYEEGGVQYFYKSDGTKLTNGWAKNGSTWYWMDNDGKIAKNKWVQTGGKWYYMTSSGAMATGWQQIGGKWYYMNSSGAMTTGWQQIGGKWYYMNSSGAMTTGWQKIGSKWYYMNSSGAMTTGWQKIGGKWYYMNSSGAMTTGWQKIGGKWYYMKADGTMATGTQTIGGKTYKFNSSGVWIQ